MITVEGYLWPDDVAEKWKHSLDHVKGIDYAISKCEKRRSAIQAGGNIGLWPLRIAERFASVYTFEPEPVSFECLQANIAGRINIFPRQVAIGAEPGRCSIKRRSLGSHNVIDGADVKIETIDALGLDDLDLLQLDIEGYELLALRGAAATIERCSPIIQVELRNFTEKYGSSDDELRAFLAGLGYREISAQRGSDFVFARH